MKLQDIRFFVNSQFDAAEQNGTPAGIGGILLMLADYLTEQVQSEPAAFTEQEGKPLSMNVKRAAQISIRLKALTDTNAGAVQEAAGRAAERLAENSAALSALDAKIEEQAQAEQKSAEIAAEIAKKQQQLEADHAGVLAREEEIRRRQAEFEALQEKLRVLVKTMQDASDENLGMIRARIAKISDSAAEKEAALQSLLNEQSARQQELDQAEAEYAAAQEKQESARKRLSQLKEERIPQLRAELDSIEAQCRSAEGDAQELAQRITEAGEERDELRAVFDANRNIVLSILAEGLILDDRTSENSFYVRADRLSSEAAQLIRSYDALIGSVIQDAQELQEMILARQSPDYRQ